MEDLLAGQMCSAGSRILVQEGIYDEFVDKLAKSAKYFATTKGDPFDVATQHMPQVSEVQLKVNILVMGILFLFDNIDIPTSVSLVISILPKRKELKFLLVEPRWVRQVTTLSQP